MEVNQKQLAEALNISARQIRNLRQQGMFEFTPGSKKYNLARCVREYIDFKIKEGSGAGAAVSKEKEAAEHERLKKQITELKLRRMKRELHEADNVEAFVANMLFNFRSRLISIPAGVAPEILGEDDVNVIMKRLNNEILAALAELSEYDPDRIGNNDIQDDEDSEDDEETQ